MQPSLRAEPDLPSRGRRILGLALWPLALACCAGPQTPSPPLPPPGEASDAAVEFERAVPVRPPRTVADVLARAPRGVDSPACSAPAAPAALTRHWIAVASAERQFRGGEAARAIQLIERSLELADTPRQREASLGTQAYYFARAGLTRRAEAALNDAGAAASRGGAETTSAEAASMALLPQRLLGRAALHEANGESAEAEAGYRRVRDVARRVAPGGYLDHYIDLDVARAVLHQGRRMEAEALLREALERTPSFALEGGARRWAASEHLAAKLGLLAEVLVEQGRFAEAAAVAQRAVDVAASVCMPDSAPALAEYRDARARALALSLRWAEAAREYAEAAQALAPAEFSAARFGAHHLFGLALVKSGRPEDGARILSAAVEAAERRAGGDDDYALAERRALLAIALLALDRRVDAFREFARAMPRLLQGVAGGEEGDVAGSGQALLRIIVDAYVDALHELSLSPLRDELPLDAVAEAFRAADAVRSRAIQKALALSDSRNVAADRGLSDLVGRRHAAARRQAGEQAAVAELYARLAAPGLEGYRGEIEREIAVRAARAAELRRAVASFEATLDSRFPEYRRIVTPRPGALAEARALLSEGEALIAFHATERATYVWAARSEGPVQSAAVALTRGALTEEVARLRSALAPEAVRTIGDIPPYDVRGARRLYDLLIAPVEPTLARSRILIVAPEEALAPLPLAALARGGEANDAALPFAGYRGVRWLAESHAVVGTPSVGSLAYLRRPAAGSARTGRLLLGFGDPDFAGARASPPPQAAASEAMRSLPQRSDGSVSLSALPPLPETRGELERIARALGADPAASLFLGARASEAGVRGAPIAAASTVVFATHGLAAGDLDGLGEPALALSAPTADGGGDGDGLLTMSEIMELRFDADWIVLSACNSAADDGSGGGPASGLARAFFYAGARSVLATNWAVHSRSAAELTVATFRNRAASRTSRAEALRLAQLEMIRSGGHRDAAGRELYAYAHPLFWAAWSLIGDGGRGAD